jgi:paraquat-inducible protein B
LAANADVAPIDVNAVNALAAQRATIQRQRDDVRAHIHLQLNMLDQFSRDIQRMRREVTSSLTDIDNQINQANLNINNVDNRYNDIMRNDNLINRNDIIHFNYDQR